MQLRTTIPLLLYAPAARAYTLTTYDRAGCDARHRESVHIGDGDSAGDSACAVLGPGRGLDVRGLNNCTLRFFEPGVGCPHGTPVRTLGAGDVGDAPCVRRADGAELRYNVRCPEPDAEGDDGGREKREEAGEERDDVYDTRELGDEADREESGLGAEDEAAEERGGGSKVAKRHPVGPTAEVLRRKKEREESVPYEPDI